MIVKLPGVSVVKLTGKSENFTDDNGTELTENT